MDTLDIRHMATSENQSVFIDGNNKIYVSGKKIYAEFTEMKYYCDESSEYKIFDKEVKCLCSGLNFILIIDQDNQI